ncbi:MAG: prenyltransferase [Anaerolineae bacterium]|nr:prenyltransferase [Anaerolineae bacterium]
MRFLLSVSRPRFWMYTAGPFLLGYASGLPNGWHGLYPPAFWLLLIFYLLPANLLLYGINDWFDADTDALNAKKEAQEHRLQNAERRRLKSVLLICVFLSVAVLALLPSQTWWLHVLFVALSVAYSAPPLRLKARPLLDSYSNVLYVLPGFIGYTIKAGTLPPLAIVIAAIGWAAGMHAYSAIPDIAPDRAAGITTVAVLLGKTGTLVFVGLNWLIFALLTISVIGAVGVVTLVYPLLIAALLLRPTLSITRVYWWLPLINGLMGFAAFAYKTLLM